MKKTNEEEDDPKRGGPFQLKYILMSNLNDGYV